LMRSQAQAGQHYGAGLLRDWGRGQGTALEPGDGRAAVTGREVPGLPFPLNSPAEFWSANSGLWEVLPIVGRTREGHYS
jgi:hypothetical protein